MSHYFSLQFICKLNAHTYIMHLLIPYLPPAFLLWWSVCSGLCLLKIGSFVLLLSFKISLFILDIIPQNVCFAKIISKSVDCLFTLLTVSFTEQTLLILMQFISFSFQGLYFIFLVSYQKSHQAHLNFLLYFKLQTMIHFGLWPKWSRAKTNWILPREPTSYNKYPFQQHKTWLYTWT